MKINQMLTTMSNNAQNMMGKASLMAKKKSPEIWLGLGVLGFVGTVVWASKATLECQKVIQKHKDTMDEINEAIALEEEEPLEENYISEVAPRGKFVTCVKTGAQIGKLYLPCAALGAFSVACIMRSHNILQSRYLGAVAAFNAVSEAFETYRKRVIEEEGEAADRHYRFGVERDTLTEEILDEKGKKKTQKTEVETLDSSKLSPNDFCRIFDESNANWDPNPTFNQMFLKGQQAVLNNILHTRGHLFLNEVYEALGFEQVPEGQVIGWLDKGNGDGFVDFGLFDPENTTAPRFVNGRANNILLNFNYDGVIFEMI